MDRKNDHNASTLPKELQVTKQCQSGKAGLTQGRAHQFISQSLMIILKDIQANKSINTSIIYLCIM